MADKKPAPKPAASPFSLPDVKLAEALIGILLLFLVLSFLFSFVDLSNTAVAPVASFFGTVYTAVKFIATLVSMLALFIIIFSFIRTTEIEAEEKKKLGLEMTWETERTEKNARWARVEDYMTSLNPSDWKVAILEADNILDDITERMGYSGGTIGERMKKISASDFPYLEEAWEAHKVRNALAHKGTDYALSRSDAEHVINIYYRIFAALGYL